VGVCCCSVCGGGIGLLEGRGPACSRGCRGVVAIYSGRFQSIVDGCRVWIERLAGGGMLWFSEGRGAVKCGRAL